MNYEVKDTARYHHGNLRDALIKAARVLLEADGHSGLSLRKCAEAVGVSQTAPQNHFGNKAGLLTAMAAEGYAEIADLMTKKIPDRATLAQRRERALQGYVEFAAGNPALYELMFSRNRILADDPDLLRNVGACFEVLVEVSKGLEGFFPDDPKIDAKSQMYLWSFVHGYAQLLTANRFKKEDMQGVDVLDIFPGSSNELCCLTDDR
ncbi:MAG: TetR/AcrR family transcriptional regulator [Pseudomonadota bacterium]